MKNITIERRHMEIDGNTGGRCGEMLGETVDYRTVELNGEQHEAIPAELIRSAACQVADYCSQSSCC